MHQIFLSHTHKDKELCDLLDTRIFARCGQIKGFRSEFEEIEEPGWRTVKDEINKSDALFFLVGKELVKSQTSPTGRKNLQDDDWRYTQNWIAYEIGVACQKGIDVWAICDESVEINFPMPYVNNHLIIFSKGRENAIKYIHWVVKEYINDQHFSVKKVYSDSKIERIKCIHCKMEFNLHKYFLNSTEHLGHFSPEQIICPQCLGEISLDRREHIR